MVEHLYTHHNSILYKEDISLSWPVRLYIFTIYIIILTISVVMAIIDPQIVLLPVIIATSVTVAFLLLYLNFRTLRIEISESQLEVRYGRFQRKVIPIGKMVEIDLIQIRFKDYGGVGVRSGQDGTWAYNTKLSDAVRVTITDDRPFAFSTNNPEKVCELLQELRG